MSNSLIFKNENLGEVRVIFIDNEPLFCLSDICKALALTNPTMVLNAIKSEFNDDLSQAYPIIDNLGRKQNATFITEAQLYFILMRSDKTEAKEFRKWINGEVLPSIRKTGSYSQKPLSQIEILQSSIAILAEQEKKLNMLENKAENLHKEQLKVKHNINRLLNNDNYMTLIAFMNLHNIKQKGYHLPSLGKKAKKLSLEQGAFMGAVIDPRYGRINTYSTEILKQIFKVK